MYTFRSILVDIDATAAAHPALEAAFDLAARFGARVTLVDVMRDLPRGARNVITSLMEQELADERLAALTALARSRPGLQVEPAVLRGRPAIALIQEVLRGGHDLVVRSHARDLVPGRELGSIDIQLLRQCPCPVWLIGPETPAVPPHVLAAVDTDSDAPETADLNQTILDLALTIAEGYRGTVTLLHAWSLYGEELLRPRMGGPTCDAALEAIRRTAVDNATALVAQFGDRGASVRIECLKGEPHVVIPAFVAAKDVDLVVMGTVGRGGIAGLLMGNTAERVLRALHGSVLAVKPSGFVTPVEPAEAEEPRVV